IILSAQVLVWLAVGGRGSIADAFIGAGIVSIGQQYLGQAIDSWYLLVLGVVFILVVRFAPAGLLGTARSLLRRPLAESAAQGALINPTQISLCSPSQNSQSATATKHGQSALQISRVTTSFGATEVLRGVTMSVASGEAMCLIGPNGAGKTTLLHIIT